MNKLLTILFISLQFFTIVNGLNIDSYGNYTKCFYPTQETIIKVDSDIPVDSNIYVKSEPNNTLVSCAYSDYCEILIRDYDIDETINTCLNVINNNNHIAIVNIYIDELDEDGFSGILILVIMFSCICCCLGFKINMCDRIGRCCESCGKRTNRCCESCGKRTNSCCNNIKQKYDRCQYERHRHKQEKLLDKNNIEMENQYMGTL
jgi:hypothetical protein